MIAYDLIETRAAARDRLRAAIDGNCVPSICPERVADLILADIARGRDLPEDLKARAQELASRNGAPGLRREGG